LPITGQFGPLTDLAVRLFQWHVKRSYDGTMEVDGIFGPVSRGWLDRLSSGAVPARMGSAAAG
jgi:hypothetical protein